MMLSAGASFGRARWGREAVGVVRATCRAIAPEAPPAQPRRHLGTDEADLGGGASPSSSPSSPPPTRSSYPHVERRQTRLTDSDIFGHVNNTCYYSYMDDAVNLHLVRRGIDLKYPRFVAESGMTFLRPLEFPNDVEVGLRVVKIGRSSVTYDVGIFSSVAGGGGNEGDNDEDDGVLAARGRFVHVYVSAKDGRPVPMDDAVRVVVEELVVQPRPATDGDNQKP